MYCIETYTEPFKALAGLDKATFKSTMLFYRITIIKNLSI